jgi:hypothetical protein
LLSIAVLLLLSSAAVCQTGTKLKKAAFKKTLSLSTGMGISMTATPSFTDFMRNDIPYLNKDSVRTFGVGLEFFAGVEYDLSKKLSLKIDYSYFIKSQTYNYSFFTYDYFHNTHQPYLMCYYTARGRGYQFKFGAGLGYHFARVSKDIGASSEQIYDSKGPAYRGEVIFAADISRRLGSYISGFVTGNSLGVLKEQNGNVLKNAETGEEVNLSGFGIGLRLGFSIGLN